MARKVCLIVAFFGLLGSHGLAQDRIWRPYVEIEGRGTSIRQLGQGNLFLPLMQDDESLLFADLRGLWTDNQAAEGNWGMAYRKILPSEWIAGAYLFYDLRHSTFNNNFHQGTAGVELLNVNWGFRANGYIPDQGVKNVPGFSAAFLQGNNIVVRAGLEAAYWGVDFEAERLIWTANPACCAGHADTGECGPMSASASGTYGVRDVLERLDAEIWAAAGVFHFDNDANGFQDITGPRVRAELRLYDLPIIGNDSRLVLRGQYGYDDVRGSVGAGMLSVRIPFGSGGGRSGRRLSPLDRRMVTPIVRDVDIVTNAGTFGAAEPAKFANSGMVISSARVVDANDDLSDEVAAAGTNSVVVVDGSAGVITETDTTVLSTGQVVMGGGAKLNVIGCTSGAAAQFCAPGTRPTVSGTNINVFRIADESAIVGPYNNVFQLADDSTITGLNITGGSNGIFGRGVDGFTISHNHISGAMGGSGNGNGVRIDGTISNAQIVGNTANGNMGTGYFSGNGFIFNGGVSGNAVVSGNTASNNTASNNMPNSNMEIGGPGMGSGNGFYFGSGIVNSVVVSETTSGNMGDALSNRLYSSGGVSGNAVVSGNTASGNSGTGYLSGNGFYFGGVFDNAVVSGNTAITNMGGTGIGSGNGFYFGGAAAAGTMASGTGDALSNVLYSFGGVSGSAVVSGNTASGNSGTGYLSGNGFYFGSVSGNAMVSGNTANGNMGGKGNGSGNGFYFGSGIVNTVVEGIAPSGDVGGTRDAFSNVLRSFGGVSGDAVISGNTASGNSGTGELSGNGFYFDGVSDNAMVSGNTANGNMGGMGLGSGNGFRFGHVSSTAVVEGKTDSGDMGGTGDAPSNDIYFFGSVSDSAVVSGNTASDNTGSGFFFDGVSNNAVVSGNTASGNGVASLGDGFAIDAPFPDTATFMNNSSIGNSGQGYRAMGTPIGVGTNTGSGNVKRVDSF